MAAAEMVKELIKPPFANYDVVVYFGCGLFSLPFFVHYLGQHQIHFINYDLKFGPEFVGTLVTSLVLLFSVYILGHILAYAASQLIEKSADSIFGKTSTVILLTSRTGQKQSTPVIREQIKAGLKNAFKADTWFANTTRVLVHIPAIPAYVALYAFGVFGFYRSRLPRVIVDGAQAKFVQTGLPQVTIAEDEPWYKALEG